MNIGQHVAHYKILERLGEGGMGVVYKAEDTVLRRTVALKFFQQRFTADEESKERLVREARAASTLDHPNICTIHQVDKAEDGRFFICMGYCEGKTLRARLDDLDFGTAEKIDAIVQIARGLEHAHERGIIHRDIKPENVIISPDGRVRIMDFGLAKLAGQTTFHKVGAVAGTLNYMSPEQVRGAEVDHRSDVWSLGAMLYEILTGKAPFSGEYEAAVMFSIAHEPVVPPSGIDPGIPADLEEVILKCLRKSVDDRYQSMGEMIEELRRARSRTLGGTGQDPTRVERSPSKSKGAKRTRRMIMYAALVSTAIVAAALAVSNLTGVDGAPVTVAVLDFENNAGEEGFDVILADLLTTDLAQTPKVRVLGRERMRELQDSLEIESMDQSSGFDLAENAGVQLLVAGSAVKLGDVLRLDASVYDVETRSLLFAKHEQGEGADCVFDMIDELSKNIRREIKVLPKWNSGGEPPLSELTTRSVEAYRLYSRGMDRRTSHPFEAVEYLKQAVALDPEFAEAHVELALLYKYQLGDYVSALASAVRAKDLTRDRGAKEHLKSLAYESWVLENWDRVIQYMREYLELQPNDMRIQRRLGWVLARRVETYEEAVAQFESIIEDDPNNVSGELSDVYNHLGNLYLYLGRFEEAIEAFAGYRSLAPNRPAPLHSMAYAHLLSGDYGGAVELYSEVIERFPDYYISHEGLGLAYLSMGKWRDALSAFRRHLAVAPQDYLPDGHVRVAQVYHVQGDLELAESEAGKALALDPAAVKAHWLKGVCALEKGAGTTGAREEDEIITRCLEDPRAAGGAAYSHHLRGRIHLAEGDVDSAVKDLREAVATCRRHDRDFFRRELAKALLEAGLPDMAIDEASELIERNPNDGEMLAVLGLAYERVGRTDRMESFHERAMQVWEDADGDFAPLKQVMKKLR